uniref:Phospholipase A2 n=2 Tax=Cacopsylla melanoneura TaxID=428564 RepID=A0A8D8YWW6_9HEMI
MRSSEVFPIIVSLVLGLIWSSVSQKPVRNVMLETSLAEDSRSDKADLIFPGTKWCGAGDIAANYSDLGTAAETDKCCRDHDHCTEYILAKGTLHGLKNTAPYTRVHCTCDQKFYDCLRTSANNGEQTSSMVGYMYFTMLEDQQCFKEDYPIVACTKKYPNTTRCASYQQDNTKPIIWQWFDLPIFN